MGENLRSSRNQARRWLDQHGADELGEGRDEQDRDRKYDGTGLFISFDLEGIASYVGPADEQDDRERLRTIAAREIEAAIEGANEVQPCITIVRDGHGDKRTLHSDLFDATTPTIIRGQGGMLDGLADHEKLDYVFLMGYHAPPDDPQGVAPHVFNGRTIQRVRLNDQRVGELTLNALYVREVADAQIVLVTGNEAVRPYAEDRLPRTEFVTTKHDTGSRSAICVDSVERSRFIRTKAQSAMRDGQGYVDFDLGETIQASVEFNDQTLAEKAILWPGVERDGAYSVCYSDSTYEPVYQFVRACARLRK